MLSGWQFFMEARKRAAKEAKERGHKWHLILQLALFAIVAGSLIAGLALHIDELIFVAGGTALLMAVGYVHSLIFGGYYSIYRDEFRRADELDAELKSVLKGRMDKAAIQAEINQLIEESVDLRSKILGTPQTDAATEFDPMMEGWMLRALSFVEAHFPGHVGHFKSDAGFLPIIHNGNQERSNKAQFIEHRQARLSELLNKIH